MFIRRQEEGSGVKGDSVTVDWDLRRWQTGFELKKEGRNIVDETVIKVSLST